VHHHLAAAPLGAGDPRAMDQAHVVGRHAPFDDRRRVGVLPGQDVRIDVDHRDVRPEAAEGLGHLAADRARTDDDQAARQFGEPEDGLVGEVTRLLESLDGRRGGAGTGGDDGA
jgi:hypothetical protein